MNKKRARRKKYQYHIGFCKGRITNCKKLEPIFQEKIKGHNAFIKYDKLFLNNERSIITAEQDKINKSTRQAEKSPEARGATEKLPTSRYRKICNIC